MFEYHITTALCGLVSDYINKHLEITTFGGDWLLSNESARKDGEQLIRDICDLFIGGLDDGLDDDF